MDDVIVYVRFAGQKYWKREDHHVCRPKEAVARLFADKYHDHPEWSSEVEITFDPHREKYETFSV